MTLEPLGWAFTVAAVLLLVAGLPEGPQQGYLLSAMLVCVTAAVLILAVRWWRGR